jgi:hypothetical protein
VPITTTYYQEEKTGYREPITEKVITFKQESNHSSPQFESTQYRQIPENYNYNEPFDIHKQSPQPQTFNVTYQPIEHHEETVKKSLNPNSNFENRDTVVTKTTEVSVVSRPIESSVQVQDNNYRSVAGNYQR